MEKPNVRPSIRYEGADGLTWHSGHLMARRIHSCFSLGAMSSSDSAIHDQNGRDEDGFHLQEEY